MPDYNEFCTDCHNSSNTIYSTTLGRNLRTIDWNSEKHGKGNADSYIMVDSPYTAGSCSLGYILACTDCHEPHGSSNDFLIRTDVNGGHWPAPSPLSARATGNSSVLDTTTTTIKRFTIRSTIELTWHLSAPLAIRLERARSPVPTAIFTVRG